MKLFQLAKQSHDGEYKFYTVENVVQFMDQKHQGKIPDIVIKLNLFEGKSKKEKSKKIDFNISISLPYFFVNDEIKNEMETFNINVEFIPATSSDNRSFYLVYPLNDINIIQFTNKDDLLDMILDGKFKLKENINLKGIYLFKDPNLITDTFFTEEFIKIFKDKLKGAFFYEVLSL